MKSSCFVLAAAVAAGLFGEACAPAHANITTATALRSVSANSGYGPPVVHSSTATGFYNDAALTSGSGALGIVYYANATQTSTTPSPTGSTMQGSGLAEGGYTGADGSTLTPVTDSLFDVSFQVDVSGAYTFTAAADWFGTYSPIDGYAYVELRDVTHSSTLATVRHNADGSTVTTSPGSLVLLAGVSYRLVAQAHVDGPIDEYTPLGGRAEWSFQLSAVSVPEAGGAAFSSIAAVAAAVVAWKRRG